MSTPRQTERCARRAAELLTAGDVVLMDDPTAEIFTLLQAALSSELRSAVQVVAAGDLVAAPTLCILIAQQAALDGSVLCAPSTTTCAAQAHRLAVPIYALLSGGPSTTLPDADAFAPAIGQTILQAHQINAIITDRGIYRPAMLARHLTDSDTPLDVIVLQT